MKFLQDIRNKILYENVCFGFVHLKKLRNNLFIEQLSHSSTESAFLVIPYSPTSDVTIISLFSTFRLLKQKALDYLIKMIFNNTI